VLLAPGALVFPITIGDTLLAGALPCDHADPFDRMLVAQASAVD
jgi:PIN domain nuclease of toxin-antitoxin system